MIKEERCILQITDKEHELIKITLKALGEYSHFNTLNIFETDKTFEVYTRSDEKQYVTRTIIGRTHWRILECYYTLAGKEEILIKKKIKR